MNSIDEGLARAILEAYRRTGIPFTVDGEEYRVDSVGGNLCVFRKERRTIWVWICDAAELLQKAPKLGVVERLKRHLFGSRQIRESEARDAGRPLAGLAEPLNRGE